MPNIIIKDEIEFKINGLILFDKIPFYFYLTRV